MQMGVSIPWERFFTTAISDPKGYPGGMESEGTAFFPSGSGCPENGNTRCLLSENNIA